MSPLVLLTVGVILVATPLSILASIYLWRLYRAEPSRLKLVLAAKITSTTVAGVLLAIPTLFFVAGTPAPLGGTFILLAIDILLPASVVTAGYLWLQDR